MKVRFALALTLFIAVITKACGSDMKDPDIKVNPHPILRYDVTIKIDGAPGAFDSVGGFMQYEVTSLDCVPETGGPMNAMRIAPRAWPRIVFNKVTDNIYEGTVYADYFKDENYFGLGTCHWSLMWTVTEININDVTLTPGLSPEQLFTQQTVTRYFVRQMYFDSKNLGVPLSDQGAPHRSNYSADRQKDIFSITLTAKEHKE